MGGGRAHVKGPGARFVRNAPFDDMDMDITFNGGSAIDGLFDMKVDYKFIQKFMFLADRPQEGSFVLYRKLEGGMWKTRVTVDNNNMMPKPFLDIAVESDRKTKLHMLFNFEEDNKWELKIDRIPGQKMTIEAVIDGQKWTGVGTLNQGDMKLNMKFDGKTPAKKFEMSFAPKTGTPIDYMFNMDFSSGFKYDYDLKINALTVEKGEGEWKWVNNAQKFELITKDTFTVHKQSPFHWMNVMVTRGREWTKMEHSRNIFFDKVNKAHLINKMKLEEHNILE